MAAEAATYWSDLPKELLNLISERLDHEFDLIRFRSICSNWRSSSIPNHHTTILPFKFPINKRQFQIRDNTSSFCDFSKRSLFLIKSPPPQQQQDQTLIRRPWLIRVTKNSSGKTKLSQPSLLPFDFPSPFQFSLDLSRFSILHLGTNFIIDVDRRPHYSSRYPKKVVAVTSLILAILFHNNHLVLLRHGDECLIDITDLPCMVDIPDMSMSSRSIRDICIFKGKLYVVQDHSITAVTIGLEDLRVELVAKYDHRGGYPNRQFLVENEGELLLVDVHESCHSDIAFKDVLTIYVFRLDEKENECVDLTSLGDRVLFLGDEGSFSASASDLYVAEGNCIIFMDDVFRDKKICHSGMVIYNYNQDQLSLLRDYPDYLNLFWPPPEWIVKGCMHKTKKRVKQRKRTHDTRLG